MYPTTMTDNKESETRDIDGAFTHHNYITTIHSTDNNPQHTVKHETQLTAT